MVESERKLQAVTFDCWGTLIYERDSGGAYHRRVDSLLQVAARLGRSIEVHAARQALDAAWHRHFSLWVEGRASGAAEIAEWSLRELEFDDDTCIAGRAELAVAFGRATREVGVEALSGARHTLEMLERCDIRRALICDTGFNSGEAVRELLDSVGLLSGLEITIFSDEVGVPKPDPRLFEQALNALDVTAESSVHVGDLRRTDVAGARRLGMRTIRIREHHDDQTDDDDADEVAHCHRDVRSLLGIGEPEGR